MCHIMLFMFWCWIFIFVKLDNHVTHCQGSKVRGEYMFACWLVENFPGFSLANMLRPWMVICFGLLHCLTHPLRWAASGVMLSSSLTVYTEVYVSNINVFSTVKEDKTLVKDKTKIFNCIQLQVGNRLREFFLSVHGNLWTTVFTTLFWLGCCWRMWQVS